MKKLLLTFCLALCIFRADAQLATEFWASPGIYSFRAQNKPLDFYFGFSYRFGAKQVDNKKTYLTYDFPALKTLKPVTSVSKPYLAIDEEMGGISNARMEMADVILPQAIHIVLSKRSYVERSDLSILKGPNALGVDFYVPMQDKYSSQNSSVLEDFMGTPYFVVIATQDGTKVKITPSKPIVGHPANQMFAVSMNKGDIYVAQSTSTLASARLEGSHITADKPIAVDISDMCNDLKTFINIEGQLVPVEKLGTEYVAIKDISLLNRLDELYVLATADSTNLYLDGDPLPLFTLKKGEQKRILLTSDILSIKSSAPVYVLHTTNTLGYSNDSTYQHKFNTINGSLIPPVKRCTGLNKYTFVGSRGSDDQVDNSSYLGEDFIVPIEIMNNFELNGKPFTFKPERIQPILGLENKYVKVKILCKGIDSLFTLSNKKGKFMLLTSRHAIFNYNQSDFVNSGGDVVEKTICEGDSLHFEYEPMQGKYLWNTGETTLGIKPEKSGTYWKTTTNGECVVTDTMQLKVQPLPRFSLGRDSTFCKDIKLTLHAPENYPHYRWQNCDSISSFLVQETGLYSVKVTDSIGCFYSDTAKMVVRPMPQFGMKDQVFCDTVRCLLDAKLDSLAKGAWSYSGAMGLLFSSSVSPATQISVSKEGRYKLWYTATNRWGCTATDTAQVGFYSRPLSSFSLDSSKCYGDNVEVRYTGNLSPQADYHWDFGGSLVLGGDKQGPVTIGLGSSAVDKDIRLWVSEHGCSSDTTTTRLRVKPSFGFSTDSMKACAGQPVKFKAWSNKAGLGYRWTFGSLGASNEQNPAFVFNQAGQYPIGLTITAANGCQNADVMKEKMQVFKPIAQTDIDPLACYGDTLGVRYTGEIRPNMQLKWDFLDSKLISQDAGGLTLLDIGTSKAKKIGLTVAENGCWSAPLYQAFRRKPHLSLQSDQTRGCTPLQVSFGTQKKYDGESYQWRLDGQTLNGQQVSHTLEEPGRYDLGLNALSSDGCGLSQSYPAYFDAYEHPKAAFDFSPHVALSNNASVTFSNQTSGALKYNWLLGDGQTSTETNPKHLYSSIGSVKIDLIAENEYGCTDQASGELNIVNGMAVATAFSPHSNVEKNRIFYPIPQGMQLNEYEFKVFNRWGNVVFSTTDPQKGWDGNLLNGEIAKNGAFVWTVNYRDFSGNEHRSAGTLLVVD